MPKLTLTQDQLNLIVAALDAMLDMETPTQLVDDTDRLLELMRRSETKQRKRSIACASSKPLNKDL